MVQTTLCYNSAVNTNTPRAVDEGFKCSFENVMIKNNSTSDCVFLLLVAREGVEPDAGDRSDSLQGPLHRRDRLIREKRIVEVNSTHFVPFCAHNAHFWHLLSCE